MVVGCMCHFKSQPVLHAASRAFVIADQDLRQVIRPDCLHIQDELRLMDGRRQRGGAAVERRSSTNPSETGELLDGCADHGVCAMIVCNDTDICE